MSVKAKNVFSLEEKEKFSGKIRITHGKISLPFF